jgi:hypothetical protein
MMIAALLATSALAAPKGWNPSFARQMLDKQMNSTGALLARSSTASPFVAQGQAPSLLLARLEQRS